MYIFASFCRVTPGFNVKFFTNIFYIFIKKLKHLYYCFITCARPVLTLSHLFTCWVFVISSRDVQTGLRHVCSDCKKNRCSRMFAFHKHQTPSMLRSDLPRHMPIWELNPVLTPIKLCALLLQLHCFTSDLLSCQLTAVHKCLCPLMCVWVCVLHFPCCVQAVPQLTCLWTLTAACSKTPRWLICSPFVWGETSTGGLRFLFFFF